MESNKLLNVLINVFYYTILICSIILGAFLIYSGVFNDGLKMSADRNSFVLMNEAFEGDLIRPGFGIILILIITGFFFIKTIFHLRKATLKMIKGEMFHKAVAKNLRWTGLSIIAYKLFDILGEQYFNVIYNSSFSVGFDFEGFESFIFILILGLFFILLSKVILNGIIIKTENDLTV